MKSYTDKQILDRVKTLSSFKLIPTGYWIVGVRSNEDKTDEYDDKYYLFKGSKFVMFTTGTTNPGKWSLNNFSEYNAKGCAVVKADEWYYDLWANGLHKGKMQALVQAKDILYYRDNDKNGKSSEIGIIQKGMIGINFHTCTYDKPTLAQKLMGWIIGKWSAGCSVINNVTDYYKIIDLVSKQLRITYCLLKEF